MITWNNLTKSYGKVPVLRNLSGHIEEGKFHVLTGPSGSGKSTLLNILGLLEAHDGGEVSWWGDNQVKPYSAKAEKLLRTKLAYLFQNFALIEDQTVAYNLHLAQEEVSVSKSEKTKRLKESLASVGLDGYEDKPVFQCSGGEQQRIAVARVFLKPCELVLADEPTGSLDANNRDLILDLLVQLQGIGKTLLVASHDPLVVAKADRVIEIRDLKVQ